MTLPITNTSFDTSQPSDMATASTNQEDTDVSKKVKDKTTYLSREKLVDQLEKLQIDNKNLIEILGKKKEDVVLKTKPVRGTIRIGHLDTGFFRLEKYCLEFNYDDNEKVEEAYYGWKMNC